MSPDSFMVSYILFYWNNLLFLYTSYTLFVLAMLLPLFRIKSTPTGKNALFNLYYFFTGLVFEPTGILNAFFP